MPALRWAAHYGDGRSITGLLPDHLPGDIPRDGMVALQLAQGSQDTGWTPILTVHLADHERLIFKRRMVTAALTAAAPLPIGLILGTYDTQTDCFALAYLNGDGTMDLRASTADVVLEPHEVG